MEEMQMKRNGSLEMFEAQKALTWILLHLNIKYLFVFVYFLSVYCN